MSNYILRRINMGKTQRKVSFYRLSLEKHVLLPTNVTQIQTLSNEEIEEKFNEIYTNNFISLPNGTKAVKIDTGSSFASHTQKYNCIIQKISYNKTNGAPFGVHRCLHKVYSIHFACKFINLLEIFINCRTKCYIPVCFQKFNYSVVG